MLTLLAPLVMLQTPVVEADGVIRIMLEGTPLYLRAYGPNMVRVTYGQAKPSLAVTASYQPFKEKPVETENTLILKTGKFEIRFDKATQALSFYDPTGALILKENARSLTPHKLGDLETKQSQQSFALAPGEAIYGLGQHQEGSMNYRGSSVTLQQKNTDVAVPMMVSSQGYGILWDNPAITTVNVGSGPEETVPSEQLFDEDGKPGLTGRYYADENFQKLALTRTDPTIDFDWTKTPPPGLPHDHYAVRWTGTLLAKEAGEYVLKGISDDGVRLWIDDKPVFTDWTSRAVKPTSGRIRFEANSRHKVRLEYYQDQFDAIMRFAWSRPAKDQNLTWTSEAADALDYYFIYGPEPDDVISGYRKLTGDAPMFAKWVWGFWQCKERYQSSQELLDVVREYRRRQIPFDGIIQDWQYWSPAPWGSHEFDPKRYPDPKKLMDDLHAENVHAIISVWPKFDNKSPNADELLKAGALYSTVIPYVFPAGEGRWYDPFNPTARRLYWNQISREIFKYGWDGWWLDASEPELGGKWGEYRTFQTAAGPGAKVFNAYPLLHTQAVYQGHLRENPAKRPFILTRSAYAGQQRNGAVTWSGDISGTWEVFRNQIPAGLNFCLSGIPYWNTDTGGFFGGNPSDKGYQELFTRWFQFSAFCPMFRVHGTGAPKEMWRFDEPTQKILADFDRLRYHLLPYIYSTSWQVANQGDTMMRGLVMDFRNDPAVYDIADQFLFGPGLMVCPVVSPGAESRSVYLPKNETWTDFWTGKTYAGGQTIEAKAPISRLPLFVRAGTILPYGPEIQYATQKVDPLEIRIYPGKNGTFTLYEDENDGARWKQGVHAEIPFTWDDAQKTLTVGKRKGAFPGMLKSRTFRIVLVSGNKGVDIDSSTTVDRVVTYDGGPQSITLK